MKILAIAYFAIMLPLLCLFTAISVDGAHHGVAQAIVIMPIWFAISSLIIVVGKMIWSEL